jgi:hypothetical protein
LDIQKQAYSGVGGKNALLVMLLFVRLLLLALLVDESLW